MAALSTHYHASPASLRCAQALVRPPTMLAAAKAPLPVPGVVRVNLGPRSITGISGVAGWRTNAPLQAVSGLRGPSGWLVCSRLSIGLSLCFRGSLVQEPLGRVVHSPQDEPDHKQRPRSYPGIPLLLGQKSQRNQDPEDREYGRGAEVFVLDPVPPQYEDTDVDHYKHKEEK